MISDEERPMKTLFRRKSVLDEQLEAMQHLSLHHEPLENILAIERKKMAEEEKKYVPFIVGKRMVVSARGPRSKALETRPGHLTSRSPIPPNASESESRPRKPVPKRPQTARTSKEDASHKGGRPPFQLRFRSKLSQDMEAEASRNLHAGPPFVESGAFWEYTPRDFSASDEKNLAGPFRLLFGPSHSNSQHNLIAPDNCSSDPPPPPLLLPVDTTGHFLGSERAIDCSRPPSAAPRPRPKTASSSTGSPGHEPGHRPLFRTRIRPASIDQGLASHRSYGLDLLVATPRSPLFSIR